MDLTGTSDEEDNASARALGTGAAAGTVWTEELITAKNHEVMALQDLNPKRRVQASRHMLREAKKLLDPLLSGISSSVFNYMVGTISDMPGRKDHGVTDANRRVRVGVGGGAGRPRRRRGRAAPQPL